ncbi:uncharacterized protein A1O5_10241 [Cladophialophora psammophila CBS 110553]|uniref:AB hydrolase-1 domain-containing protein n=1 Tax=Cladophialophora psammophila CBS 110553 TaxID=1182543 RepID=W9WPH5_9EURO|nr:uncharacterized protein A1O5_10241 [Cladophialophora psammophila CBS 110553]EXJ66571.1 hypothetical protein A1O5_10241 [Cladophialophora psammophila CBS 110553]
MATHQTAKTQYLYPPPMGQLPALGVKEVDVLGLSIGGFVAQLLALNHADGDGSKVRKLIMCESTASVGPDIPETDDDYKTAATRPHATSQEFKELFCSGAPKGEMAAEE